MTTGLLDQRGRIYTMSATLDVGVPTRVFTFSAERWCRVETPTGADLTLADREQHTVDAVLVFREGTAIPRRGVVTVGDNTYELVAVLAHRKLALQRVLARYVDTAQADYTLMES